MEANYNINAKNLGKYIGQVKRAREQVQSDFTTNDKILHGGGIALNSVAQIAANREGNTGSALESAVTAELKRQGLQTDADVKKKELESVNNIDAKQLSQRYEELNKLKSLLFRSEIKNRRISKIKSKLYHKLKKREKDREEKKLRDYMEEIDPEAAKAYREKEEMKVIEERLRVRHGTTSKFAKNLKRFKKMDDKDTREAYQ